MSLLGDRAAAKVFLLCSCIISAFAFGAAVRIDVEVRGDDAIVKFKSANGVVEHTVRLSAEEPHAYLPDDVSISSEDPTDEGFYKVAFSNLTSGAHYQVKLFNAETTMLLGEEYFFTDCEPGLFQCVVYIDPENRLEYQDCLSPDFLCDGRNFCVGGADEGPQAGCKGKRTIGPCLQVAERAMALKVKPPVCDAQGDFNIVQCDSETSKCYCVNPKTGEYAGSEEGLSNNAASYLKCETIKYDKPEHAKPPLTEGMDYLVCPPEICGEEE